MILFIQYTSSDRVVLHEHFDFLGETDTMKAALIVAAVGCGVFQGSHLKR